jgi:hypothetical protein
VDGGSVGDRGECRRNGGSEAGWKDGREMEGLLEDGEIV